MNETESKVFGGTFTVGRIQFGAARECVCWVRALKRFDMSVKCCASVVLA